MDVIYRPLLPPTQYCPCNWRSNITSPPFLEESRQNSLFFRVLFAPYSALWVNPTPTTTDNSPDVSTSPQQADINFRVVFERRKKLAARDLDATALLTSLYVPKGRWQWTHQVSFEDRPEEVPITSKANERYSLSIRTAKIYNESITYIRKLWPRGFRWDGFTREVMLHKTQLRPLHGALVPALIGIHNNFDGIQMTYDVPHHSFWVQASPDMPDVLKRRCLEAYYQLHAQGVLHGDVDLGNILIGGDGRVKIINFDKSRSVRADARVQLELATANDFKMEMREVHYKLNYNCARDKEHEAWENRNNSHELSSPPRTCKTRLHDKAPFTVVLEPPINPDQWSVPSNWRPRRFVVPGQSAKQFEYHLNDFLLSLEEDRNERKISRRYKPRKRKIEEVDPGSNSDGSSGDYDSSSKRVRFLAITVEDDGTTRQVKSPPPPGVKRLVPRVSPECRNLKCPFDPDEDDISTSPASHSPAPSGYDTYPGIPPRFNQRDMRAALPAISARQARHSDNDNGPSDRALGKRKQSNRDSPSDDGPRPKCLRRSETTLLGAEDLRNAGPSTTSPRTTPRASPSPYSTRSSSRRPKSYRQPLPKSSKSSPNRPSQAAAQAGKTGSKPSGGQSVVTQQPGPSSLIPSVTWLYHDSQEHVGASTSSSRRGQAQLGPPTDGGLFSMPLLSGSPLHIPTTAPSSVAQAHDEVVQPPAAQAGNGLRAGGTDSFESIALVFEGMPIVTLSTPPRHSSVAATEISQAPTVTETTRLVAGQFRSLLLTVATEIGRIFSFS